jgi:hypothetical protein
MTYVIEFTSGHPSFKGGAPETLKAVISTFGVGRVTYNIPLIVLGIGLGIFAIAVLRTKRQEKAARLKSIKLVQLPKKPAPQAEDAAPVEVAASVEVAAPAAGAPAERPFPDWRTPSSSPKSQ